MIRDFADTFDCCLMVLPYLAAIISVFSANTEEHGALIAGDCRITLHLIALKS